MSHDATGWARKQTAPSSSAKFVLLVLADFADGQDYSCYPSIKKLAEITQLGESTIRQATKQLAEAGLLRVFYRHRDDTRARRSCRYQLLPEGSETPPPDISDWSSQRQNLAGGNRQDLADPPPGSSGPPRQDLALIPSSDPSLLEPSSVSPGAPRTARATRIPDDFYPTPQMQQWFKDENLQSVIPDPRIEHEKFCDYWRSKGGADARKVDWPATWRNWMRTAAQRATRTGRTLNPTDAMAAAARIQNMLTREA